MKNKTILVDDLNMEWFDYYGITFSPWVRHKMIEYIIANGGIDRNIEGDENYGERDSKAIFERTN